MSTIPQNKELRQHLFGLLQAYREIFKQERVYQRVVGLSQSAKVGQQKADILRALWLQPRERLAQ